MMSAAAARISLASLLVLAACSSTDPALRGPLTVPIPTKATGGPEVLVNAYYRNVFEQLSGAYRDRDRNAMWSLLEQHTRDDVPNHVQDRLARYRILATGVDLEKMLASNTSLAFKAGRRPLSEAQDFALVVQPDADSGSMRLGSGDATTPTFLVSAHVEDLGASGSVRNKRSSMALKVERGQKLGPQSPLQLGFAIPAAQGNVAMRRVHLQVELLTCQFELDGTAVPVRRTLCSELHATRYPSGVAPIRRAPLVTLRAALRRGDAKHFRHVFLAGHFMPARSWDAALPLLMQWVRTGTPDQARVAMITLDEMLRRRRNSGGAIEDWMKDLGADAPPDRESWLRWWENYKATKQRPR